jgi:dihydroorotate dehydrogenase electron transfer subunit
MSVPGNFVTILPPSGSGGYLRRPFSIAGKGKNFITLVIRGVGKVTDSLSTLKEGSKLEIIGPLGNSYPEKGKEIWMIGGGTGIASVLFLSSIREADGFKNDRLLWAGQTSDALPELYPHPVDVKFATDDGTKGEKGNAAEVLKKWLKVRKPDAIAACGPHGMLKAVKEIGAEYEIETWLSLEEFMACGVGACAGCAVELEIGGYEKACEDGPVFSADRVVL